MASPSPIAGARARIPFNRPLVTGREAEYIAQAIEQRWLSGDGPFTHRCQQLLQARLGVETSLLTTSCTHALEMAALLLDVGPGDEVIIPTFTFVSTANAFVLRGATPVFADSRADTLNIDERQIESLITRRTRAIALVHYAGVACEMDAIVALANAHKIAIVEDTAHALLSAYRGRMLGTFGSTASLSFHETKNVTCGEGGALLINDANLVERAEILREKGTNRSRFHRGQIDKYTWVDVGSSYLPSDMLAAYLLAQLEALDDIQHRRRAVWNTYHRELAAWAATHGVAQPTVPPHCDQSWHMYYLVMPTAEARTGLIAHLAERSVSAVFHYIPLHQSEMGQRLVGNVSLPVAESVSERLLRLPMYADMTESELAYVLDSVRSWRAS
ncbi:MAG TPA: dTDP-4-amino-4,6-dideoxygalactose transaminase [Gemmatimonadaceae bacterium]|nr:dTDP-4-amino-4,6-dideoxygalactose transaminase [Gemmatimonadaceae bacterium]